MRKKPKKLTLSRETVSNLSPAYGGAEELPTVVTCTLTLTLSVLNSCVNTCANTCNCPCSYECVPTGPQSSVWMC